MPWTVTDPMLERAQLVALHAKGLLSMTEIARRGGVSRKTGYKWVERYDAGGADALTDRSHARHSQAHRTPPGTEALIVACRRAHPTWGPRKLLDYLAPRHPSVRLPAVSTAGAILDRHGLIDHRPKRCKHPHPGTRPLVADAPNDVWTTDCARVRAPKGEFKTGDGVYCYPLTVCDAYSRMVLCVDGFASTAHPGPVASFLRLFAEHGLPVAIRSDNGVPFVSPTAIDGLSPLNVLWTRLDIRHDRIRPGRPDENGQHERMHRTLKAETARSPERDQTTQQGRFGGWQAEFNDERPHEALGGVVPSSLYAASGRRLPPTLPQPEYAGHAEVRRVSGAGGVKFKGHEVFVSRVLIGESVALSETSDGVWDVHFYRRLLGRMDERTWLLSG